MTRHRTGAQLFAFGLVLLLARCQCIVSEYDIQSPTRDSGVTAEAGPEDAVGTDLAQPDASLPDTLGTDTARPDALLPDTLRPDTNRPDILAMDTLGVDVNLPDAAQPDTSLPDTLLPDTLLPDTAPEDTGPEDLNRPDTYGEDLCVADCAGKCGDADDGCGGTCVGCPAGQWCSGQACLDCDVAAHCGPNGGACLDCSTFATNKDCISRSCGCDDNGDCAATGEYCAGPTCAVCNVDTACGADGETCIDCSAEATDKVCISRACGCGIDANCAVGQWCDNGSCGICNTDTHCGAAGVACVDCTAQATNKICVVANRACGCGDDDDCALGQWCNNGACEPCTVDAHCGADGVACVDCASQSENKSCLGDRTCGCTVAATHCFAGQICNASSLCEGNVNQCSTGAHDCDPCSETCADLFDPNEPIGWECNCATGFYDDGGGCAYDDRTPPDLTFDITIPADVHDLSQETNLPNRGSCADAPSYSVTALGAGSATVSSAPACCLNRGDDVILINLQGVPGATDTVGHWELIEVGSVSGTIVNFKTSKTRNYGSGASNDSDIGTAAGQQRVMLLRVPVYGAVTLADDYPDVTLTSGGWDGYKGGILAVRMGSLALNGVVSMLGKGYMGGLEACGGSSERAQQGESIAGLGINGGSSGEWVAAAAANIGGGGGGCYDGSFNEFPGGGGGYGVAGTTIACTGTDACNGIDSEGGLVYGGQNLSAASGTIFLGSGGGGGGGSFSCMGNDGGGGGGAVILLVSGDVDTATTARIYANGEYSSGADGKGGGSGGSLYIQANDITVTEISQPFYARGGNQSGAPPLATGGDGRIHFACTADCSDSSDDAIPAPYMP